MGRVGASWAVREDMGRVVGTWALGAAGARKEAVVRVVAARGEVAQMLLLELGATAMVARAAGSGMRVELQDIMAARLVERQVAVMVGLMGEVRVGVGPVAYEGLAMVEVTQAATTVAVTMAAMERSAVEGSSLLEVQEAGADWVGREVAVKAAATQVAERTVVSRAATVVGMQAEPRAVAEAED